MTVLEVPQNLQALALANAVRIEAARQRRELIHAPVQRVVPALIDPSPGLGIYKLTTLFPSSNSGHKSLIRGIGGTSLVTAFRNVEAERPAGRRWHRDLRLDQLTRFERQRLVRALVAQAPRRWREAA